MSRLQAKLIGAGAQWGIKRNRKSMLSKSNGLVPAQDDSLSLQELSSCGSDRSCQEQVRTIILDDAECLRKSRREMMKMNLTMAK